MIRYLNLVLILALSASNVAGRKDIPFNNKSKLSVHDLPSTVNIIHSTTGIDTKPTATTATTGKLEHNQAFLTTIRAGALPLPRNIRKRRGKPEPEPPEPVDPNIRKISQKTAVGFGLLLALNSGIINGVCLSGILSKDGTKQASAAVTGAWTNSALGAASGNYSQFMFNLQCILSYASGSFMSGFLNPNPKPFQISIVGFRSAFLIGAMLLYGSSTLSEEPDKVFICLAAMANGIQNSLTSTTTGNLVRSTHFSGITSDMGTFMGQIVRGNMENLNKFKVFFSLAMTFWTGGYLSFSLTRNYGKGVLLLSSFLFLIMGLAVGLV